MTETHQRIIPTQKRAKEKVGRILAATRLFLSQQGFEALTTNHIAELAEVPIGSVYRYFPDKDALVAALIDEHTHRMLALLDEKIAALANEPLPVGARSYVKEMLALHGEDPALHQVLYAQAPRLRGRVRDMNAEAQARVRAYLEIHRAELEVEDLDMAAFMLTTSVEAITHQALRDHQKTFKVAKLTDEITALALGYLKFKREGEAK